MVDAELTEESKLFPTEFQRRKFGQPHQIVDTWRHVAGLSAHVRLEKLLNGEVCEEEGVSQMALFQQCSRCLHVFLAACSPVINLFLNVHERFRIVPTFL